MENMKLGAKNQRGEKFWAGMIPALWRSQDAELEDRAMALLEKFKLDAKADDFAASLSGGQRKLLEMARSLMTEPTLVMLDEPMAGVNPALTQSLLDHIIDLKHEGMTVLFVEHDMHMVRHIADWVVVMAEGKIVAEGDPTTVMNNPAVIDAYLGAHQELDLGVVTGRIDVVEADPTTDAAGIRERPVPTCWSTRAWPRKRRRTASDRSHRDGNARRRRRRGARRLSAGREHPQRLQSRRPRG